MSGGELSASIDLLLGREAAARLTDLERAHRRALSDNPEGSAVVLGALHEALRRGVYAQGALDRFPVAELDADGPDAWADWQSTRAATPESRGWPKRLAKAAPEVVAEAGELLVDAGHELGLHGRQTRHLRDVGEQAAEAEAALTRSLTRRPARDPAPVVAFPGTVGAPEPDGTVRVALAANQAECELIQGMLQTAGIPSTWRRTGGDLPGLLSAGYREVYVPAGAAADAQALMSTSELPGPSRPEPRSRKVGLERTGVRLIGKATALLVALGAVISAIVGLVIDESTITVVATFGALVIAIAAVVAWSERANRSRQSDEL